MVVMYAFLVADLIIRETDVAEHVVDVLGRHSFADCDSDGDAPAGGEQWPFEGGHGFLSLEELPSLRSSPPQEVIRLYWVMRLFVRRFHTAKANFGPRRQFKGARLKRSFKRKGPAARSGGRAREGFYCGSVVVSLGHVPGEEVEVFL